MSNSPIEIFKLWYQNEQELTKIRIPSACCLSTNGIDGFPNSRFVSLKDILDDKFIITGNLTSRKGICKLPHNWTILKEKISKFKIDKDEKALCITG